MSRSDLLFYGKDLGALIRGYETTIKEEVGGWDRNRIMASSESDLLTYLVDKYSLDPPRLLREQINIEERRRSKDRRQRSV